MKACTREQVDHVLAVTRGTELEIPTALGIGAGLRLGEMLALRWNCVDFDRKEIRVIEAALSDDGKILTKPPKSESGVRVIPMPVFLRQRLLAHREEQAREAMKPGCQDRNLVIADSHRNFVRPNTMSRRFSRLFRDLGYQGVTLHSLRRTYASELLKAGSDRKVVSELMGHSRTSLTEDIYYQTEMEQHRRTVQKLDDLGQPGA